MPNLWIATLALTGALAGQSYASNLLPVATPASRGAAFVEDPVRGVLVLHGTSIQSADTWEFDGVAWTKTATGGPQSFVSAVTGGRNNIAWDSQSGQLITIGFGSGGFGTWGYGLNGWSYLGSTLASPNPTYSWYSSLATHPVTQRLMTMFYGANLASGETAEWNGSSWGVVQTATPGPYDAFTMCNDPTSGTVVALRGGETWLFDGVDWAQSVASPPGTDAFASLFANGSDLLLLARPQTCTGLHMSAIWRWSGGSWLPTTWVSSPSDSHGAAVAEFNGKIVITGGSTLAPPFSGPGCYPSSSITETWEIERLATFTTFGQSCSGSWATPQLSALAGDTPVLGQTFDISLTALPPLALAIGMVGFSTTQNNSALGQYALPLDLTPAGMVGCTQYVSDDVSFWIGALGSAVWTLAMPADTSLVGRQLHVQAVIHDPAANPIGFILTNAGTATLGW